MDAVTLGAILASGLATTIGGLFLLLFPQPSDRLMSALLGFTAGVMLAATSFSLLVPALDRGALWEVLAGLGAGAVVFVALDTAVPHIHARFVERGHPPRGGAATRDPAALGAHDPQHPRGARRRRRLRRRRARARDPARAGDRDPERPRGLRRRGAASGRGRAAARRRRLRGRERRRGAAGGPPGLRRLRTGRRPASVWPRLRGRRDALRRRRRADPQSHARGREREATVALLAGFALMLGLDNAFG